MVYKIYTLFEFDETKSESNKLKHGIDFWAAQEIWENPHFEFPLITEGESRWAVIGLIEERFWTAIFTKRSGNIRIISVRRSRHEEKQIYQNFFKEED